MLSQHVLTIGASLFDAPNATILTHRDFVCWMRHMIYWRNCSGNGWCRAVDVEEHVRERALVRLEHANLGYEFVTAELVLVRHEEVTSPSSDR
jgi:hypothetical protein